MYKCVAALSLFSKYMYETCKLVYAEMYQFEVHTCM